MSSSSRELFIRRLKEAVDAIPRLQTLDYRSPGPSFESWRERVCSSLEALFPGSEKMARFTWIQFRVPDTYTFMSNGGNPTEVWAHAWEEARSFLSDAIEEAELLPPAVQAANIPVKSATAGVVVNIHNSLNQTVDVRVEKILGGLEALDLTPSEHALAAEQLRQLGAEASGRQSWGVIAKCMEGIKELGKGVYEKVAVPLLVEYLRQQVGLPPGHRG